MTHGFASMMTNGRFSWRRLVDIATPFLCLTLLLWTVAAAPAAYAACGPRFVAITGSNAGPNDCLTAGSPCLTIQYAIDQACAGDTINVAAGIYVETVTAGHGLVVPGAPGIDINKAVVLKGAGAASTTIQANGGHCLPASCPAGQLQAVTLSSSGITIDGFTILETDITVNLITADGAVNSNNHIIKNNVITNPLFDDGGAGGGWGILLGVGASSNNQITGNDISLNPILATNEFTFGIWDGAAGPTGGPSNNNVINGNTIHNVGIGIILDPGTGNVVSGNQITDNAFSGIYHFGDTGTQVTFNSFLRNHASGIQVRWGATNIVVTGNCFQDNGVNPVTYLPSGNTDVARGAIRIGPEIGTIGTQMHDNNFAGDLPYGVEDDSSASTLTDHAAELNWWGCPTGANTGICDSTLGNVDFTPFLSAPSDTPPCSCTLTSQCPVDSNVCTDDICAPVVDIAQGQTATQSSNLSGFDVCGGPPLAPRAVDGNTDGNYFDCSVAVTQNEFQPWWQVNLGSSQDIASIKVWNRTDPSTVFWSNFHVLVSNNPALLAAGNLAAAQLVADHDFHVPGAAGSPTTIVVNFPGQYVRVQLEGTNYLQLAEVQVIAGGCVHPNNTAPCDDGLACTGTDTCAGGVCTHTGDPCLPGTECNTTCQEAPVATFTCFDPATTACTSDGNVCSVDQCNGAGLCDHSVATGATTCDDGQFCTGLDTCIGAVCNHAGNPCTGGPECANVCDETNNTCNLPAGTACTDDTLFCDGTESCNGSGACAHSGDPCLPLNITDANCSTSCDETANSCIAPDPNGTPCNDALACDGTDQCNGGTCSVHSSSCAPHITMGQNGSTTVMGLGRPSLGPGCLEIFDCGFPDACQNGNDTSIGTGGTNSAGKFTITVDPALICQEHLYVVDICAPFSVTAPDIGPVFVVDCAPAAPLLSPQAILFLVAALGMVGLFGLRRVTPRR